MPIISLNEPAGVLIKTTLVDFPGLVAGSFFLKGCNLRCPYCYNKELVKGTVAEDSLCSLSELFAHLEKRKNVLSGLVISGGEPLMNPYTKEIILKGKELGYNIKIDTNGTFPDKLKSLLEDNSLCPDFVAMDIKTSPSRYGKELLNLDENSIGNEILKNKICESAAILKDMPVDKREFRTVLVPGLVTRDDIKEIAEILPIDASWQFAQFQNNDCLDSSYNEFLPYTDKEITDLVNYAKKFIKNANLR